MVLDIINYFRMSKLLLKLIILHIWLWVMEVKWNNIWVQLGIYPQLNHNEHLVDGMLVGVGSFKCWANLWFDQILTIFFINYINI
jgi:hypothetical protein